VRQVILDTETTGLEVEKGHRIIEIGCVELINRRRTGNTFHRYLNPDRQIDEAAAEVHGITAEMLTDKPGFPDVAEELLAFIGGAELVIHNADFDAGFLDQELRLAKLQARIHDCCVIVDSLALARQLHPGQRNSLDALCRRYQIDNSGRDLHGALLDAQLLADVYLAMTGGQAELRLDRGDRGGSEADTNGRRIDREGLKLAVRRASVEEQLAHERCLDAVEQNCQEGALWRRLTDGSADPA
jgi:DNA polymerase-3 subunit epsilon